MVGLLRYVVFNFLKCRVIKLILVGFVVAQFTQLVHAQSGIIKGKVLDAKIQQPLPFASVYINNTTRVNASDKGEFLLKNIPEGEQELVVSFVGYQQHQSKVLAGDTTAQLLIIKLNQAELKPVEVVAEREFSMEKTARKI